MLNEIHLKNLEHYHEISDEQVKQLKDDVRALVAEQQIKLPENIPMGVERVPQNTDIPIEGYHLFIEGQIEYQIDINADGSLNMVVKLMPFDSEAIEKSCISSKFPMKTPRGEVAFSPRGNLCLNNKQLRIRNLCNKPLRSHEALYRYEDHRFYDTFVLMPAFNEPGYIAFVANRYAWGMNVNVCLLDAKKKIVYCWQSYNYDHPVGLALRRAGNGLQIYLSNDEVTREVLYKSNRPALRSLENFYPDSRWYALPIERDFKCLYRSIRLRERYHIAVHHWWREQITD